VPDPRDATAPCPDLADLLLASEGELSKRRQAEVSAHLRLCPACREQLGSVGLALREYQDAVADANATTRAADADASADRLDVFRDRLQDERRTQTANRVRLPFRRWLPVAAAVPVLVGALFFSNRYTSVLRAEELLTKAAAQEQTVPANTVRRLEIHIKRTGVRTTRDVGTSARLVSVSEHAAADVELTRRLAESHLDPQDPLSVRAFRTWHDSLRAKTDSVSPAGRDALALHTETDDGLLQSVELIVRRIDFQPLRATFVFADLGEVEITELSRWVAPASTIAEHAPAPVSIDKPAAPDAEALDEAELDVRTALHRTGADTDRSIRVTRSKRAIEVRGHIATKQKVELVGALHGLGSVRFLLGADEPPREVDSTAPSVPSQIPLQRWLKRTFGMGDRAATFVPDLASDADLFERRASAFAALANRYPESETRAMSTSARQKLEALADAKYHELVTATQALDEHLALFLGTSTRSAARSAPRPWQTGAETMGSRSEQLRRAIRRVLAEPDLPLPTEIGPANPEPAALSELRQALDAVWEVLRPTQSS
jgi:hypothetical protein